MAEVHYIKISAPANPDLHKTFTNGNNPDGYFQFDKASCKYNMNLLGLSLEGKDKEDKDSKAGPKEGLAWHGQTGLMQMYELFWVQKAREKYLRNGKANKTDPENGTIPYMCNFPCNFNGAFEEAHLSPNKWPLFQKANEGDSNEPPFGIMATFFKRVMQKTVELNGLWVDKACMKGGYSITYKLDTPLTTVSKVCLQWGNPGYSQGLNYNIEGSEQISGFDRLKKCDIGGFGYKPAIALLDSKQQVLWEEDFATRDGKEKEINVAPGYVPKVVLPDMYCCGLTLPGPAYFCMNCGFKWGEAKPCCRKTFMENPKLKFCGADGGKCTEKLGNDDTKRGVHSV